MNTKVKNDENSNKINGWKTNAVIFEEGMKYLMNTYTRQPVVFEKAKMQYLWDIEGNIFNINADTFASEIASKFEAKKMILLTDVDGIKITENDREELISRISASGCAKLIKTCDISKGMIPKVNSCIHALSSGVERTHILNGNLEHSILIEIFTDKGIGTMIVND